MNYGYVKVAAAVPRVKVADCKFNASEIEKEIIITLIQEKNWKLKML